MGLNFNNMKGTFIIDLPEKYIISVPDINGNETNPYFVTMLDKYCDLRIRFIIYMIVLFILSLLLAYLMGVPI